MKKGERNIKSFKKYSWLISAIFAVLVFISGLTANDISFLPVKYQSLAVGIIGASAVLVKLIPENYRFDFDDVWKTVKIKDIFDERSKKGFLDLELLSVTLNDGVIKRSEIESKDNSSLDKSNYKLFYLNIKMKHMLINY